jgi:pimeloyl-ACP methyl ester carboxylesterase
MVPAPVARRDPYCRRAEEIMGGYLQIGDLKTWYDEQGAGESLVLLHGGLSTNATWASQMPDFANRF